MIVRIMEPIDGLIIRCRHRFAFVCLLLLLAAGQALSRPNILLITSEDHSADIACYGDQSIKTPHLDALAGQGVRFENAYVTYSVCSPSRASILTGLYPHQNGQLGLATHKMAMFRQWPNMISLLRSAGYRTGMIGKLHVNPAEAFPLDMHELRGSNFGNRPMQRFAEIAERFFREESDQPFFLMVNYPDAHKPFLRLQHGQPVEPVAAADVTVPAYVGVDTARLRKDAADYYNCLLRLDAGIGLLMDALRASGKADQTLVVWLADHGANLARGKTTMYEAGLRVPMIVRWPGEIEPGSVEGRLVSAVDLLPTVLDAADIDDPDYALPGRSLLPMMRGEAIDTWRQHLCCVHTGSFAMTYAPQRSVRDSRYKLIINLLPERENQLYTWYYAQRHAESTPNAEELAAARPEVRAGYQTWARMPRYELYDMRRDPYEWTNLAENPEFDDVRERLIAAYRDWQRRTADPLADPAKLDQLTAEYDALIKQYGAGSGYRKKPGFRWGYLEYLRPDPRQWRSEWD